MWFRWPLTIDRQLHANLQVMAQSGGVLVPHAIRRNSVVNVRELKQQIELVVQRYSADAHRSSGAATAESALQKIEKIAKRMSATGH